MSNSDPRFNELEKDWIRRQQEYHRNDHRVTEDHPPEINGLHGKPVTGATNSFRPTNVYGGSNEEERGTWCTPKRIANLLCQSHDFDKPFDQVELGDAGAAYVHAFDLDPCSNPRSHIVARMKCMLEDGGNGLPQEGDTGAFITTHPKGPVGMRAGDDWDVFINPPYERGSVIQWVRHYRHTNFTFLLKWDPSTEWFGELLPHCHYVWFPFGWRIAFEPPPGVKASSNPFPHALYMRNPNRARFERLKSAGIMLTVDDENVALLNK